MLHHPPSSQKTATAVFFMRRVHPPTRCQAGTRLLHPWLPSKLARSSPVSHTGSEGSNILRSISPQLQTCSPISPCDANTPWSAESQPQNDNPPSNNENDANQLLPKIAKFQIVSHESVVLCYQYAGPGNRNPSTTLVGPSPAPDLCMHIFIQTCGDFRSREIRNGEIASRSS